MTNFSEARRVSVLQLLKRLCESLLPLKNKGQRHDQFLDPVSGSVQNLASMKYNGVKISPLQRPTHFHPISPLFVLHFVQVTFRSLPHSRLILSVDQFAWILTM